MKAKGNKKRYLVELYDDQAYELGGWLKDNAGSLISTVAGAGMSLIPGMQSVGLPMMVSGAAGMLGGAFADKDNLTDYSDETVYPRTVGRKNMTPNVMHFEKGGLMEIEGPTHEEGGVDFNGAEVEGGETVRGNVVNSDTWKINKSTAKKYNLKPVAVGKTPAEYSKIINKQYKKKENMIGAENDLNIELGKIDLMSVEMAPPTEGVKMQGGGPYKRIGPFKERTMSDIALLDDPLRRYASPEQRSLMGPWEDTMLTTDVFTPNFTGRYASPEKNPIATAKKAGVKSSAVPRVNESPIGLNMSPVVPRIGSSVAPEGQKDNIKLYDDVFGYDASIPEMELPAIDKISKGVDMKNLGQTALGLAPMAVNAFLAGRTAAEGPDKVKLPRIQYDPMHPELIDPAYQIQEARDAYATGNQQMSQVSKKDFLRRRIQSATEEGKTTSGIRGAANATNAQLINSARQINKEGQMRTNFANLETTMREEELNAANKGAWQTSRDYYMSNLGTMAGEYGRDLRLEEADAKRSEQMFGIMDELSKEVDMQRGADNIYRRINAMNASGIGISSSANLNVPAFNAGDVDSGVVVPANYNVANRRGMLRDYFRNNYFRQDR